MKGQIVECHDHRKMSAFYLIILISRCNVISRKTTWYDLIFLKITLTAMWRIDCWGQFYYIIIVQSGGKLKSYCMIPIELCGTLEWCHEGRSRDWLDSDIFIEDKTNEFNSWFHCRVKNSSWDIVLDFYFKEFVVRWKEKRGQAWFLGFSLRWAAENEEGNKTFQGLGFFFQCENLSVLVFIYPIKFSKSSLVNKPTYLTIS